jgi:hypothetical protein
MLEETRKVLLLIFIAPLLGVLLSLYLPRPWKVPKLEWRYVLLDVGVLGLALCCVYLSLFASSNFINLLVGWKIIALLAVASSFFFALAVLLHHLRRSLNILSRLCFYLASFAVSLATLAWGLQRL